MQGVGYLECSINSRIMRKLLIAYFITLVLGVFAYLSMSDSNFRLMSLDDPITSLMSIFEEQLYPEWLVNIELKEEQLRREFESICLGVSCGLLIWAVLFILHRIQIFVVDLSAFLPLKK